MIDFHCHLDLYPDPSAIMARCAERDLYVLSVTTTPSAWQGTVKLAEGSKRIRTALGIHPQVAHERQSELALFDQLVAETRYVGEIGLDGTPEFRTHWQTQLAVFDHVLNSCASVGGRILSVHSRRAGAAVLDRLEAHKLADLAVLHWFSGSHRDLHRAVTLGCWFSVGPAMLGTAKGKELTARMPRDRVLTESDGPFAQIAGAPVMPWQVDDALRILKDLWSVSRHEAEEVINRNLRTLSTLVSTPWGVEEEFEVRRVGSSDAL